MFEISDLISESKTASAASRGYYSVLDSSSSGSDERGGSRSEDEPSSSSESGFDVLSREIKDRRGAHGSPKLSFGQFQDGEPANSIGVEGKPEYFTNIASLLARPTENHADLTGGEGIYFLDTSKYGKTGLRDEDKTKGNDVKEYPSEDHGIKIQYNDALYDALDRKYEEFKNPGNKALRLFPSGLFGITQAGKEMILEIFLTYNL